MQKNLKICLLLLLSLSEIFAKEKWQSLKPLSFYDAYKDFNPKVSVGYLEIREYVLNRDNRLASRGYERVFTLYRKTLEDFDKKSREHFINTSPLLGENDLDLNRDICGKKLYNAVMIDRQNRVYKMNMRADIISYLGEIDTKGELALIFWLFNPDAKDIKYRKTAKGYDILKVKESAFGVGRCLDYVYKVSFDKKFKRIKETFMSTKKSKRKCEIELAPSCGD